MPVMSPPSKQVFTTLDDIRGRFNQGLYWERSQQGEFTVRKMESVVPTRRIRGEPKGTKSQIIEYADKVTGERVALVHQYRRRDGSLGGSGRPDPKQLREGDTLYIADEFA